MAKSILRTALLCAGWLAGCGGDSSSGVSGSKALVSLSDGEITDLCEYLVDVSGPRRTVDCGPDGTIAVGGGTVAVCETRFQKTREQFSGCTATVDNAESCFEDLAALTDAQWCTERPASCEVVISPACGGV